MGTRLMRAMVRRALERHGRRILGQGHLWNESELKTLARWLASVRATAELLARYQVRRKQRSAERRAGVVRESETKAVLQSTDYSCGAACVAYVLNRFGKEIGETEAIWALGTSPSDGTTPDAITAYLSSVGLDVESATDLTLGEVDEALRAGAVVIAAIQAYGTSDEVANNKSGHYVVITNLDNTEVRFMDPSSPTGWASLPHDQFQSVWHDQETGGEPYARLGIAVGRARLMYREDEGDLISLEPMPPVEALKFFTQLEPRLGTDPLRFGDLMERQAFTLARATDTQALGTVQDYIRMSLESGKGFEPSARGVTTLLDSLGLNTKNPSYAEMVMRTNAMDSYNTASERERRDPDVVDTFPVWQYSNPDDERSRAEHAERDGNYYPSDVSFFDVRGQGIEDAANCRCVPIPISKWDWADLHAAGARVADGFPDVPPV